MRRESKLHNRCSIITSLLRHDFPFYGRTTLKKEAISTEDCGRIFKFVSGKLVIRNDFELKGSTGYLGSKTRAAANASGQPVIYNQLVE